MDKFLLILLIAVTAVHGFDRSSYGSSGRTSPPSSPITRSKGPCRHTLTLHYFNTTGRAELIRLVLAAAGQSYTDTRINPPEWPRLKSGTPWGSLPYLVTDGKKIGQAKAVTRYVSHECGLGGSDAYEQGLVDSIVEHSRDVWDDLYKYQYGTPDEKSTLLAKLKKNLPTSLRSLEKFIAEHGQNGFTVGRKLTTADLAVFDVLDQIQADPSVRLPSPAAGFPKTQQVLASVRANPNVARYLAQRKLGKSN